MSINEDPKLRKGKKKRQAAPLGVLYNLLVT